MFDSPLVISFNHMLRSFSIDRAIDLLSAAFALSRKAWGVAVSTNGRFHPVYDDESLGGYATPQQAAEDLAGGPRGR
jgi:hypothetical protein